MSQVEDVLAKLGVEHRRQGNRAWAERCPLPTHGPHNEAHLWQNWFVRLDRGERSGYHCFSCKGAGQLVELVMLLRSVGYREAREWVRGIVTQDTEAPFLRVRSEPARLPGAIAVPGGVQKMGVGLERWNSVPRDYVLSRGITDEQVRRWRIGYALEGRLEGRILLPIFDRRDRLANYAARSFIGHEKRYLAAGSWEDPDKVALFGEHRWPAPGARGCVVVFEGALNGLAIEHALSAAGCSELAEFGGMSGLDEGEGGQVDVRTLMKLATFRRVIVATDPDHAGDRAADAIARALLKRATVTRLELPRGRDAADLWREDPGALGARVRSAVSGEM